MAMDPDVDRSMMQLIESVLGGGGEMGERMRAFDWSTTALGPLEQWPQSLRICVRIMLGSGYPMAIGWGPDYTLLYNDAQRVLFGTKDATALGRRTKDVFPESWEYAGPLYDRVMRQGQAYTTLTDQLVTLNRNDYLEECYFALSYSPIPDDSGQVGGVFVTGIETTERVIEERRQQVLRDVASRTAEARYEDEVWRVSTDTLREHRLTIPFAVLYACPPTERNAYLVGSSIEPDALDPPVIDCTRQNLWGFDTALPREGIVVELGQRASVLPSTSWPVPPEKAAVVPIRLRENSDAAAFLVLGIHPGRAFDDTYRQFVRRIAEQIAVGLASARAYELQLRRADALAEIDRAKTAFFSNVSHEFRTPLQLMLGPLEAVLPEAVERLGPERHQQLLTVRRNALRLLKLVNTLLDFSRLEARRLQAVYRPTDLAGLTSDIASLFRSAMDSAGLTFSVECQPIGEPVFVDRGMWEKIVLNLLSNALKFTFEGEVAISLRPVTGAVEFQVRDTGVGIPDDQCEKVFERFHRIERASARTHEGTGIGLALVHELVTLHGGSVRVTSAVGVGSTFTVTIPRGKEHLPAESIHAEQSPASTEIRAETYVEEALRWLPDAASAPVAEAMHAKQSSLGSSREVARGAPRELIVLADDNRDMREYLTRLLGDRYEVHAVADGRQALEAARQLRPALVLADVMMPQLDGFGLLRAIREDSALCSTPVILVSARAGEESCVEGLQADADDYLVKPFTSRELLARVATQVKMANLRRVAAEREERLRNEAQVEQAYLFLAEAQRLSKTGSWSWNASTGKVVWSQEHWRILGLDPQDTNPSLDEFWERVHPDDRIGLRRTFESAIRDKRDFEQEFRIVTPDRSIKHLHGVGHAVLDKSHDLVEFIGSTMDITDRKRAQELASSLVALRADVSAALSKPVSTREMLRECAEAVVRRLDAAFARIWTSNDRETMLELQASAGMYTRLDGTYSCIPFGDLKVGWIAREKKPHLTNDVLTDPRIGDKEWARSCGMVSFAGYPLLVEKRPIGVMAMFARYPLSDDTLDTLASVADAIAQGIERKRAEEELGRSEAYLAEAQRLSSIGTFSWRVATDEITWSEQLYRIYEIEIGEPVTLELIRTRVHPEDLSLLEKIKMVHRAGGGATNFEWQYRLLMPNGSIKYMHAVAHAARDRDGQLEYVAAVQDVTERKVAEQALNRARAELAHMARITTLSALTASIAHEINQPIAAATTSAGACLRWLNRDQPDVQRAREAAMRIEEDGKRAADIITHLKSFYRKDFSPQREMVSVNDVVGEMLVLLRSEAERDSVLMRTELDAHLSPVSADRVQLQQVLMNLMLNGMEAMSEWGGELKISTRREGGEVMVSVSDTGVGIPADKMEQIFNAFFTTRAGGTGMGLAISRTIIESHGGRLWATVNPGRGATFHFTLPTEPEAHK
jgi:signal transduction histidine kinase/DNA-binding response OmpR family regulator